MESAAVRRLKELIAANDSPPASHSTSTGNHAQSSKFSLPSPSPYVQRFQPLLATPTVTASLASRRPSPQLPTPPPTASDSAQSVMSSNKSAILNDFENTLLMLRMQRMELEAESRVRLMEPTSPTRHLSSSGSHRAAHSHGNSPHVAQDSQQQHSSLSSANDLLRLESCATRAEIAARRVEECTSQCRLILQQVETLAKVIQRSHADAVGSVEDAARAAAAHGQTLRNLVSEAEDYASACKLVAAQLGGKPRQRLA